MARTSTTLLILACIVLAVSGQVLLKRGMDRIGRVEQLGTLLTADFYVSAIKTWQIPAAIAIYVVGLILWMTVLSRESLSYAYPFLALTYFVAVVADAVLLGTPITTPRWIGAGLVTAGLALVWRS